MVHQYQIHDLERLTGIKAPCIRTWEKRYNIISPLRTSNNRRVYDSDQLLRLLNISTLVTSGYKISHLARLNDVELTSYLENLYKVPRVDSLYTPYLHNLIVAMMRFDETAFVHIFDEIVERLGVSDGMKHVIYPFLQKTSVLWRMGKMMVSHEHFASTLIRQKLLISISQLPVAKPDASKFLLFMPEGEWDDLGLLLANYVIRSRGNTTLYLGQNIPYKDIEAVVDTVKPDQIITFFASPKTPDELNEGIANLVDGYDNIQIFVSGNGKLMSKIDPRENVHYLKSIESILEHI